MNQPNEQPGGTSVLPGFLGAMNDLHKAIETIDAAALKQKRTLVERAMRNCTEAEFESLFQLRDSLYRESCLEGLDEGMRYEVEAERRWEAGALGETDSPWYPGN